MRVELQPAYVLHSRAYKDTSLLIDVLSADHGRLTLIAKGARKPQKKSRTALQPFLPMRLSWLGKGSLKTLLSNEPMALAHALKAEKLYSALYMNELLVYLLKEGELIDELYDIYHQTLIDLVSATLIEIPLRRFEFSVLAVLGYGLDFLTEAHTGLPIKKNIEYGYVPGMGFVNAKKISTNITIINGKHLLAIASDQWQEKETLQYAKQLARIALSPYLKGKVLKSRAFFSKPSVQ